MYDFDKLIDRKDTGCVKWDLIPGTLPMWVADMDFECYPGIADAIKKRIEHTIFGYSMIPDSYFDSYISWWERRHQVKYEKEWMCFATGVVPAISSMIRHMTKSGDKVIILSPVYNMFYNSITSNGRTILSSDLIYQDGCYTIDFKDLENKMADPDASMMILCNPHNPIGKIWGIDDLREIAELALKYHVLVISDEIHCDIIKPGLNYVPYISVSEAAKMNSVTTIAATKCFGIPGLQSSAVVVPNSDILSIVKKAIQTDGLSEGNAFSYSPVMEAFDHGEEWVFEMNSYVEENKKAFMEYLKDTRLYFVKSEATYLLWVDISSYTENAKLLCDFLKEKTGLFITEGNQYGKAGATFVRINLATQRVRVLDGAKRLKEGLISFDKKNY